MPPLDGRRATASSAGHGAGSAAPGVYAQTLVTEISPALYRAGAGEPLLLLHGFLGTWRHWRPVLGELVARYEVIAPTLAGHDGGPPYPISRPATYEAAADSLESHLDELGVGTAHVVGNSAGGALALELAKRGRARSVVALAPAGGWSNGDGEAKRLRRIFALQVRLTRAVAPRVATIMRQPDVRRLAMRRIMRHGELVARADAVDLALASLRCAVTGRVLDTLGADRDLSLGDLHRISCPVLLAWPQFDRVLPAERHAPRLRREIPGVESLMLAGCGHVPMWDDSRLLVRTISEFVDRHVAAAPSASAPAVAQASAKA
jgi:pimeloyl-ACP methyl ester carboxylesterase